MRTSFILLAAFSADFGSINEPLSTIGIGIFEWQKRIWLAPLLCNKDVGICHR
jgi:hypothetical protein